MNNYRVVMERDEEGGCGYRIEDVYTGTGDVYPFVQHGPHGLLYAGSLEELKNGLRAMLRACDQPILELTRPVLREWPPK